MRARQAAADLIPHTPSIILEGTIALDSFSLRTGEPFSSQRAFWTPVRRLSVPSKNSSKEAARCREMSNNEPTIRAGCIKASSNQLHVRHLCGPCFRTMALSMKQGSGERSVVTQLKSPLGAWSMTSCTTFVRCRGFDYPTYHRNFPVANSILLL